MNNGVRGFPRRPGPQPLFSGARPADGDVFVFDEASGLFVPQAQSGSLPTTTKGDLIVHDGSVNDRLPVSGTNGRVLVADSGEALGVKWGSPSAGSGGASILLDEVVASADANIDLVTGWSDDYDEFEIHFDLVTDTDGDALAIRTSTDGGSNFDAGASDYKRASFGNDSDTAAPAGQSDAADSEIDISTGIGNAAGEFATGRITCYGFRSTSKYKLVHAFSVGITSTGASQQRIRHGFRVSTTAVNGVRIFSLLGANLTGVARLYGIAK